jgi:hypothetical protein
MPGTRQQECHKRDNLRQADRCAVITLLSAKQASSWNQQENQIKIKAYRFTIAITIAGPLAIATAATSFAATLPSSPVAVKAAAPAAATGVRYRKNVARQCWNYDSYYKPTGMACSCAVQ